jgi:hypothetical protein
MYNNEWTRSIPYIKLGCKISIPSLMYYRMTHLGMLKDRLNCRGIALGKKHIELLKYTKNMVFGMNSKHQNWNNKTEDNLLSMYSLKSKTHN